MSCQHQPEEHAELTCEDPQGGFARKWRLELSSGVRFHDIQYQNPQPMVHVFDQLSKDGWRVISALSRTHAFIARVLPT